MIHGWAVEGGGETGGSSHVPPKAVCEIVFVYVSGKGLHSPLHLIETYDPILRWRETKKHLQHLDSLGFNLATNFSHTIGKQL